MVTTPLTVPLAQAALHNDPRPSRPSPPTARPVRIVPKTALEPDRSLVDKPAPEAAEVAAKKRKRSKVDAETRAVAVARVVKLIGAGNPSADAIATVAKELGVSESAVYQWRAAANKAGGTVVANGGKETVRLDGLDLILDIIELCERAKKGLTRSQRARLKAALNERLS